MLVGSLCLLPVTFGSSAQLAGHWEGTMVRDGVSLEVRFDFSTSGSQPRGTFTSVTQQAMDYPLNVVTISADGVHFALGDSLVFDGKLVSDHIVGTFADDGASGKFTLHRSVPEALPYDSVDVIFHNGAVALSGTLCNASPAGATRRCHTSSGKWWRKSLGYQPLYCGPVRSFGHRGSRL